MNCITLDETSFHSEISNVDSDISAVPMSRDLKEATYHHSLKKPLSPSKRIEGLDKPSNFEDRMREVEKGEHKSSVSHLFL